MLGDDRPRLFLDTAVLISLALSTRDNPPGRYFFDMAIYGFVDLVVSRNVTAELEGVLRDRVPNRAPALIALIAENFVLARATNAAEPNEDTVRECMALTGYRPDARILAAAIETACEILVTGDRKHLLGNPNIGPPKTSIVAMDISEALEWCRTQVSICSRNRSSN
jgi:predicted nucleic acid-binding protein